MIRSIVVTLSACLISIPLHRLSAQTEDQGIRTHEARIVDSEGRPIANAVAEPLLLDMRYTWPWIELPSTLVKSNEEGVVTIRCPSKAHTMIPMNLWHADYCSEHVVLPEETSASSDKPFEIVMKPGIKLSIDAVEEDGNPVSEPFAVIFSNGSFATRFNRPQSYSVNCRSLESGNHQIMLVQPRDDGLHGFSEVLIHQFDAEKEPHVKIQDVEIRQGITVRGKLRPNVPRPILKGRVVAVHVPFPLGASWQKLPSLLYFDSTVIKEDGSFVFASMPRTGIIQLIAYCDGWVGLQEDKEDDSTCVIGETFEVDEQSLEVELEMEPTFDAVIRVLDKTGQPLPGVTIAVCPQQLHHKGAYEVLGQSYDSISSLRGQLKEIPDARVKTIFDRYQGISNENGRVVIHNLPRNHYSIRVAVLGRKDDTVKINLDAEGKLPASDERQVEFDVVVDRKRRKPIPQR